MSSGNQNIELEKKCIEFLIPRISGLEAIYIFGSQAKENTTKDSDVDIAFLSNKSIDNVERWNIQQDLSIFIGADVDLVNLQDASEVMCFQVVREGKRIYQTDRNNSELFEDKVYYLYLDLCENRQGIINNIQESGSIYG